MPPRQITSYFQKLPATANAVATATSTTARAASTSTSPHAKSQSTTGTQVLPASRAAPGSDLDGDDPSDRPAKRAKVGPGVSVTTVSPSKTLGGPSSFSSPRASSREQLREKFAANAKRAELLRTEVETMGEDWLLALQDELTKPYFLTLKEFITVQQASKKVFPPAEDVYSWSRLCPLKDVRVVIIGQDPYHDDGQAHGLAFSVRKGVRIPPSLRNIYKEMNAEVPAFKIPKHGDLTEWAKHGVLLLNTALTVRAHEAGSHSNKGWETFTAAVLKVVTSRLAPDAASGGGALVKAGPLDTMFAAKSKEVTTTGSVTGVAVSETVSATADERTTVIKTTEQSATPGPDGAKPIAVAGSTGTGHVSGANGVCFMAWGAHAQKMCAGVDTKKHLVLKSVHPSPLAAMRGFFGNDHFVKANTWLEERYGPGGGIDWAALGDA